MFNIEKYLQKFSKNIETSEAYKKQVIRIIKDNTGIDISLGDVEIKNSEVLIKASPSIKNKLFINKDKILKEIGDSLPIKIINLK